MGAFIIVLIVVVSVLLALIILVQNPKGGGLASGFQSTAQVGGVQRTTDFLEKATWYLGVALFVLCLVSARFYSTGPAVPNGPNTEEVIDSTEDSGDATLEELEDLGEPAE